MNLKEIAIKLITIFKKESPTHNLEVAKNHNYMVGKNKILTHNTDKVFKYASEETFEFAFYMLQDGLVGETITDKYVGITTQLIEDRFKQHKLEGKAARKGKKPYYKWKADTNLFPRTIQPHTKMTFFEATVWETYYINEYGGSGLHKGIGKLLNRKTPMGKTSFNKWKKTGKFNPCTFF